MKAYFLGCGCGVYLSSCACCTADAIMKNSRAPFSRTISSSARIIRVIRTVVTLVYLLKNGQKKTTVRVDGG